MKLEYKLIIIFALFITGLFGLIHYTDTTTHVETSQISDTNIPQQYITNYEDLSEQQKQLFRDSLSSTTEISQSNQPVFDHKLIQLDNEIYRTTTDEAITNPLFLLFLLITALLFFELYRSIYKLLQKRDVQYQTYIMAILLFTTIFVFVPLHNIPFVENQPEVQISTQPAFEDNITQDNTTNIIYLEKQEQTQLYEILEGGQPVEQEQRTYKTIKSSYLTNYNFIQSNGEYYQLKSSSNHSQGNTMSLKILLGLFLTIITIVYITFIEETNTT